MAETNKPQNNLIIKGSGKTKEEAFSNTAKSMFNTMVNTNNVQPQKNAKLKVTAKTIEELLFKYLNELIAFKKTKGMFYSQFRTKIVEVTNVKGEKEFTLEGVVFGEKVTLHKTKTEIRKVILESIKVSQNDKNWTSECSIE